MKFTPLESPVFQHGVKYPEFTRGIKPRVNFLTEFTNSNPALVGLFLSFLRKIIKIDESRLRGELFVYHDLDTNELEKFWSRISGIALSRFNKTIILRAKNSKYRPNPNGTFKIRYHSKDAFQKLDSVIHNVLT